MCSCLSRAPCWDLAHSPGMCPDWESNQRRFGSQASTQSTEPHQPGLKLFYYDVCLTSSHFPWALPKLFCPCLAWTLCGTPSLCLSLSLSVSLSPPLSLLEQKQGAKLWVICLEIRVLGHHWVVSGAKQCFVLFFLFLSPQQSSSWGRSILLRLGYPRLWCITEYCLPTCHLGHRAPPGGVFTVGI